MSATRQWLWSGFDSEGIEGRIAQAQWDSHVANRPEIEGALALTIQAPRAPEVVELDRSRTRDEPRHWFRLVSVSGEGQWEGYWLRVSVKWVLQPSGKWIKFYQSCWYERK